MTAIWLKEAPNVLGIPYIVSKHCGVIEVAQEIGTAAVASDTNSSMVDATRNVDATLPRDTGPVNLD